MQKETQLIAAARAYLGVRFAHQGRRKETGVDCLGLLLCAAQDAGLRFSQHDRTDYRIFPDTQMLRTQLDSVLQPVPDAALGRVALFSIEGRPQHLALITDYPVTGHWGMIHAYAPLRKVVEHRLDTQWQARVEAYYALRED